MPKFVFFVRIAAATCSAVLLLAATEASAQGPAPSRAGQGEASSMPVGNPMEAMASPTAPPLRGVPEFTRSAFDSGDVAWGILRACAALAAGAGLFLFYAGLSGTANIGRALGGALRVVALLSLAWAFWAYSFAFAPSWGAQHTLRSEIADPEGIGAGIPLLGGPGRLALDGLAPQSGGEGPVYPVRRRTDTVPELLFFLLQGAWLMIVALPLVVGLADRLRPPALALLLLLWGTVVYAPLAHWVWGSGWLRGSGMLDYAGGSLVHVCFGFSALGCALIARRRAALCGDSTPLAVPGAVPLGIGAAVFWTSALILHAGRFPAADATAANAAVGTHLAASAGLVAWMTLEWLRRGRGSLAGAGAGALAGLAAIASGSGYVAPQSAIVIGVAGGAFGATAFLALQERIGQNGLLAPLAIHGVPGTIGLLLVGVFATSGVAGSDGSGRPIDGLLAGDVAQLAAQAMGAGAAIGLALVGTLVCLLTVRVIVGLRPPEPESQACGDVDRAGVDVAPTV